MKLKTITITGMHNTVSKTYDFSEKNLSYLFGSNGSGKSTVLEAIQLALLGYIPGTDKKKEAIFRHAKGPSMTVEAVLESDKGSIVRVTRAYVCAGKTITSSVGVEPEGFSLEEIIGDLELPIHNFQDFLGLTSNKMKEWFINFLPGVSEEIDWRKELVDSKGDVNIIDDKLIDDMIEEIELLKSSNNSSGTDLVKSVNEKIKGKISFMKGELARAQSTIQSLIHYDDCDEFEDPDAIRESIREDNLVKSALIRYNSVIESNSRLIAAADAIVVEDESEEVDRELESLKESYAELENKKASIQDNLNEIKRELAETIATRSNLANSISSDGICPFSKMSCQSIVELAETSKKEIEKLDKSIEALKKKDAKLTSEFSEVAKKCNKIMGQITTIQSAKKFREANRAKKQSLLDQVVTDSIRPTEKTLEEIDAAIAGNTNKLVKLEANTKYNELSEKLTAEKFKIENSIEVLKIWEKHTGANGLQNKLMDKPFQLLSEDIDTALIDLSGSNDVKCKFILSDKANSFSFGLERNDQYIPFTLLSSGEKCIYTFALLIALTRRSKSSLKMILVDDLLDHLDPNNANSVFESLYNLKDIQFILAGVLRCEAKCADDIVIEVI